MTIEEYHAALVRIDALLLIVRDRRTADQQAELDSLWLTCEGHDENRKAWREWFRANKQRT